MRLSELLYWDMLSDLVSDDFGTWEFAWRANTLAGGATEESRAAAADVIRRLIVEGLAEVVDRDTGRPVPIERVTKVLGDHGWAKAEPTVMMTVHALDKADGRILEMPQEAADAINEAE